MKINISFSGMPSDFFKNLLLFQTLNKFAKIKFCDLIIVICLFMALISKFPKKINIAQSS